MNIPNYQISSIGKIIKNPGESPKICINAEFRPGMEHLDKFSHLLIFWWATQCDNSVDRQVLRVQIPQDRFPNAPQSGVFSSRSPARPNPIMLTIIIQAGVDYANGIITTPHIDAHHDTPVIDVKPYLPSSERVIDTKVAPWLNSLNRSYQPPGPPR